MSNSRPDLLIIDPDPVFRADLSRNLEQAGFAVISAENDCEGLSKTREHHPDFVLCDWLSKKIDAARFCRRVKADPGLRDTHVALLGGPGEDAMRRRLERSGADEFLPRNVAPSELIARVRAGLRQRSSAAEAAPSIEPELERTQAAGDEINNALTGLLGHLELIRQYLDRGDTKRSHYHLDRGFDAAERMAGIANRLCGPASETQEPVARG